MEKIASDLKNNNNITSRFCKTEKLNVIDNKNFDDDFYSLLANSF